MERCSPIGVSVDRACWRSAAYEAPGRLHNPQPSHRAALMEPSRAELQEVQNMLSQLKPARSHMMHHTVQAWVRTVRSRVRLCNDARGRRPAAEAWPALSDTVTMGNPEPGARWPEHLPVGALRVVRWSARYDQTISFYRTSSGCRCWKPSTTATAWTARSLGCPAVPFTWRSSVWAMLGSRRLGADHCAAGCRRHRPGGADRLLAGQRRRYIPGPRRARGSVRVLDLPPALVIPC